MKSRNLLPQIPGLRHIFLFLYRISFFDALRVSVIPAYRPGIVRIYGNPDTQGLFRKEFLNVFRPLHYAQAAAVEVVVQTYVHSF